MKFQTHLLGVLSVIGLGLHLFLSSFFLSAVQSADSEPSRLLTASLLITSSVLYLLLCLWYLAECVTFQTESPSMTILGLIQKNPEQKISFVELQRHFTNEHFLVPRIEDLVSSGFVIKAEGKYILQSKGTYITRFILGHRRMLRRGIGG